MKILPHDLTSDGRKEHSDAQKEIARLSNQPKLSKKERQRLEQMQGITRRVFLERLGMGLAGLSLAGLGTYQLMKEKTPEGIRRFTKSVEDIHRNSLGTARWAHPDGGTDEAPIDPVVFVDYPHAGSPDAIVLDDYARVLHRVHLILSTCFRNGLRKFGLEGMPNQQLTERRMSGLENANGQPVPAGELRAFLAVEKNYIDQMRQNPLTVPSLFAGSVRDQADLRGTENPDGEDRRMDYLHNVYTPALDAAMPYVVALHGLPPELIREGNRIVRVRFGDQEFAASEVRRILQARQEVQQHPIITDDRDRYLLENCRDREVLLMGGAHIKAIREGMVGRGKSFCSIKPADCPITFEDIREDPYFILVENFLRRLNSSS